MGSKFDESEFIDADFQSEQREIGIGSAAMNTPGFSAGPRPPSREELDLKMSDAHQKLAELKRVQEQLERERATLEESRRRRAEYQTGRDEMLNHLTRGTGILEEAEFAARREAEQMAKTLTDLRAALAKVEALNEASWTQENWNVELSRALTTLENARMEWNSARLKWPLLDGNAPRQAEGHPVPSISPASLLEGKSFSELCQIGLALTWPVSLAALLGATVITVILLGR